MGSVDFKDLPEVSDKVRISAADAARNAAHLARLLHSRPIAPAETGSLPRWEASARWRDANIPPIRPMPPSSR